MPNDAAGIPPDGWALYDRNDFAGAERAFRAALATNPNDAWALNGLATSLIQLGRAAEAPQFLSKAASLVQKHSFEQCYNLFCWAIALRTTGDLAQAKTKASELTEIFPDYAAGWYQLGLILRDSGDFHDAADAFRAAHQKDPGDIASADKLVDTLVESKQLDAALQVLSDLNELQKSANLADRARTLRNWAILLRDRRDLDAAAEKAKELVDTFPEYAPGWNTRAIIRQAKGDLDGAIHDYREVLEAGKDAAPEDRATWMLNLGDALRKKGAHNEAIRTFRDSIAMDPKNANAHNGIGLAQASLREYRHAIESYKQAVSLWGDSSDRKYALRNWANVLIDQKKPEQAAAKLREALDADRNDPDTHNRLGLAIEKLDLDAAIRAYEEADRLWKEANPPERKYALRNWASVLIDQNKPELALAKLLEALDADRNDPDTQNTLLALAQRNPDVAILEYRKVDTLWKESPNRRCVLRLWANVLNVQRQHEIAQAKCQEALQIPGKLDDCWLYLELGRAFAGQGYQQEAIDALVHAGECAAKSDSNRRHVLWSLGDALLQRECFKEALDAFKEAVDLAPPQEALGHFLYGCALDAARDADAALIQYEQAIIKDEKHPYAHNNKANLLFRLGKYPKGWTAWNDTRKYFEPTKAVLESGSTEPGEISKDECVERAVYYADALRDVFAEYEHSLYWYELALKAKENYTPAVSGRAILFRRWSQSQRTEVAIQMRGNQAMGEACEQLKQGLERPDRFHYLLVLADLLIEDRDWARVRQYLDWAERECGEMRLRRAEILVRRGILSLGTEKPEEAARLFQQALVARPGDLALKTYLGQALLNAKQYEPALRTFRLVLDAAEGHVEALIGSARASIELADDGDVDQYELAEKFLTDSLKFGRNCGSTQLRDVDLADVYYMRGYAKTKRYEADRTVFRSILIASALSDFRQARKANPRHGAARLACSKVAQQIRRRTGESASEAIGMIAVSLAATIVFAFAQIDFFLRGTWLHRVLAMPANSVLAKPGYYATVTFAALAIMIAGVSLRKLLKLKVAGIELEKTSADRVAPAAVLGIGRFGQFENFTASTLRGLAATPGDLSRPPASPESEDIPEGKETDQVNPQSPDPSGKPQPIAGPDRQSLRGTTPIA